MVIWPKLPRVSCSSVVEHPTGVRKIIGLTSVWKTGKSFPSSWIISVSLHRKGKYPERWYTLCSYLSCYSKRKFISELDITGNFKMRNLKMNAEQPVSARGNNVQQSHTRFPIQFSWWTYLSFTELFYFLGCGWFTSVQSERKRSSIIRAVFNRVLLRSVIGLENSRHLFNQSDAKPKPIVLIGSFCCLRLLWLAIVIALILVSRYSIENRSIKSKRCVG